MGRFGEGEKPPVPLLAQNPVEVGPLTFPFNATAPVLQIVWFAPAETIGAAVICNNTVLVDAGQTPLLAVVNDSVINPLFMSAALGI